MPEPLTDQEGPFRVYPPSGGSSLALLVWVHGGAFEAGDIDMPEADWVARRFARSGIVVVSVDYRLASATVSFPLPSDDVLTALNWALDNSERWGLSPSRVFLGGASAGGNLAAGAVIRLLASTSAVPTGVFLAYPTLHAGSPALSDELEAGLMSVPSGSRWTADRVAGMYRAYVDGPFDIAPAAAIPGKAHIDELVGFPPTLMVNDEYDDLRASGEAFAQTLIAAGVDVDMHTAPGTVHGHLNTPELPQAEITVSIALDWMRRTMETANPADQKASE